MNRNLTPAEFQSVRNSEFFRVKASATGKIDALLALSRDKIKAEVGKYKLVFPKEADTRTGKIFRGENYLGLPYLVLDYPKYFSKDSVFALRTMFWWGNFFSCTLHLQGKQLEKHRKNLLAQAVELRKKNLFICVHPNSPWHYHYAKDNYCKVDSLSEGKLQTILKKKEFIKLSARIELKEYKSLPEFARETASTLFSLL